MVCICLVLISHWEIKDRKRPTFVTLILIFIMEMELSQLPFSNEKTINWMKGNESSFIN